MTNNGIANTSNGKDSFIKKPGWFLFLYLVISQGIPAINYDWGVLMGTQDSAEYVTEVGACFWYGFAVGDLVWYIPLLGVGLHWFFGENSTKERKEQGRVILGAALGITIYWPIVCLTAAISARRAPGFDIDETPFLIVLPVLVLWALYSFIRVVFHHNNYDDDKNLEAKSKSD